ELPKLIHSEDRQVAQRRTCEVDALRLESGQGRRRGEIADGESDFGIAAVVADRVVEEQQRSARVEETAACTYNRLSIVSDIPSDAEARRILFKIVRDGFRLRRSKRRIACRSEIGIEGRFITETGVDG